MPLQHLMNTASSFYDHVSKSLVCLSKAGLNHLEKKSVKHGTNAALNSKRKTKIAPQLARGMSSCPCPCANSRRSNVTNINKMSKPIYGRFFPAVSLEYKYDRGKRYSFSEQHVSKERSDFELALTPGIQVKSSAGICIGKSFSGGRLWRNLAKANGQPVSFRSITNRMDCGNYEDVQKTMKPTVFYGEQCLRSCRIHKSQFIKRLEEDRRAV